LSEVFNSCRWVLSFSDNTWQPGSFDNILKRKCYANFSCKMKKWLEGRKKNFERSSAAIIEFAAGDKTIPTEVKDLGAVPLCSFLTR